MSAKGCPGPARSSKLEALASTVSIGTKGPVALSARKTANPVGVVPAGTDGALRQRHDGTATREQLDAAGEDADESLVEARLYEEQEALEAAGTEDQRWSDRAGAWLNQHRRTMTFVAGAAVIAAVGFMTAARMRD